MYHSLFSPCFVTNKESVRRNFNTMKILYFSSKNFPNLAFPGNSCLIQSLLWGEQKNHFPAQPVRKLLPDPLPHATYSDGLPSLYVFLCMHVCIHLFIYLLQVWTHEFVFLQMYSSLLYLIFYNDYSVDQWALFRWFLHPCIMIPPAFLKLFFFCIFSTSLLSGIGLCFRFTLKILFLILGTHQHLRNSPSEIYCRISLVIQTYSWAIVFFFLTLLKMKQLMLKVMITIVHLFTMHQVLLLALYILIQIQNLAYKVSTAISILQ